MYPSSRKRLTTTLGPTSRNVFPFSNLNGARQPACDSHRSFGRWAMAEAKRKNRDGLLVTSSGQTRMMDTQHTSTAIESALATLQPLRDLSRNWDVDIASCLEEYLQELTGLSGSQLQDIGNPGDTIPNFAHAALILQNSSNVYSRKVEYLHGLVYKALYEFFQTTTAKESRSKSADASIDDFYDFDPNEDFLLLDDVVPEDVSNTKINLKEDEYESNNVSGTPLNQSLSRTRLSLGGLSVTRVERSSLGGGAYLTSSSQQRALLSTLNNGSLRLVDGLCDVGEDGILLMPGSQSGPMTTGTGIESQEPVPGGKSLFTEEEPTVPLGDCDDDHSNDGPGFDLHNDQDYEESAPVAEQAEVLVDVGTAQHAVRDKPKRVTFAQNVEQSQRTDPWALLDPHSNRGFTPKPLRKGKTYRLPEGMTLPPSECVTGASTRRLVSRVRDSQKDEVYTPIIIQTLQALLGKRQDFPRIPIDGLVFGDEFLYLAKEAAKVKAAKRRDEKKKSLERQPHAVQEDEDDDDDDYGGGYGFAGDDDNDDNHSMGNAGVASMDEAYQGDGSAPGESNFGKTFEELCRAHIQAFAKGAEEFAFSTKLTDRVAKWQAKLAPILEEEERRAEFDIQKYSTSLLESAKQGLQRMKRKSDGTEHAATKTVEFASLTKNCTQSDVCRLFLASLTLANSGNICINEEAPIFSFEVISSHVERPMETYRAPSLAEQA